MTEQLDIFVDKFYVMDPKFEDLLPSGIHLQTGMIVLVEDSLIREDTELYKDERSRKYQLDRLREINRWCTVSDIEIMPSYDGSKPVMTFIATYADGTKRQRRYSTSYAWIVKKETIPDES